MDHVSIVIPVWNQWPLTRACLAALASARRPRDEVIVVDNGSRDATAAELARMPWLRVLTNEANRGFAAACNQGAAVASGSVVVFLNNDTLVPDDWLEGLLAPLADPAVVATGPMSNCASGPQGVERAAYDAGSLTAFRAFAARWRRQHLGQTQETPRLVGFCLAVRASALRAVGGWDEGFAIGGAEDDDLCLRLTAAGGGLRICRDTFVHHHGHATFVGNDLDWFAIQQDNLQRLAAKHGGAAERDPQRPLLSACLIVRDERELLPVCLASLEGLADEIVVYDTGSTDGTPGLARAAGARVVEGYWDDDFGGARNRALAHCGGDWVLQVDADECVAGDAGALRAALAMAAADAFLIAIQNLDGDGKSDVWHRSCRLFRRADFRWQGRLHEQVVPRAGARARPVALMPHAWLIHGGYTPERMQAKRKAERNIRLATLETAGGGDPVAALVNLGRSYMMAGRREEALGLFVQARALACDAPSLRRILCRSAAQLHLDAGRAAEALPWLDDLERASAATDLARYLRGRAYADLGRWRDALEELGGLEEPRDEDGTALPRHLVDLCRARCHFVLGEWAAAADAGSRVARGATVDEPVWHILAESCLRAGRALRPLLDAVPESRLSAIFAQLVRLPPAIAHPLLDAVVDDPRYRVHALALAIRLAPSMSPEQAAVWSDRLRAVGLADHCPPPPLPVSAPC
ncbi:glycosyltransferase [bacterium]|nr:glycosyltransferase [bacterium]